MCSKIFWVSVGVVGLFLIVMSVFYIMTSDKDDNDDDGPKM